MTKVIRYTSIWTEYNQFEATVLVVSVLLNIAKYTNLETFLIVLTDLEDNNFEKVEIVLNDVGIWYLVLKVKPV